MRADDLAFSNTPEEWRDLLAILTEKTDRLRKVATGLGGVAKTRAES